MIAHQKAFNSAYALSLELMEALEGLRTQPLIRSVSGLGCRCLLDEKQRSHEEDEKAECCSARLETRHPACRLTSARAVAQAAHHGTFPQSSRNRFAQGLGLVKQRKILVRIGMKRTTSALRKVDDARCRRCGFIDIKCGRAVYRISVSGFAHFFTLPFLRRTFVRVYNRANKGSCQ